jgi:uncharacterized protein YggT (Ycf19 family)
MRKIPPEFENPIDDFLLDICDRNVKLMRNCNITPNMITIVRIILSFFILFVFYNSCDIYTPILGFGIFYYLDCLDGHLARGTDQVTVLGDYLDHFGDIFNDVVFFIIILCKDFMYKDKIIGIYFVLLYLAMCHLGLQQIVFEKITKNEIQTESETVYDKKEEELLDQLNKINPFTIDDIKWTKYFGLGTFNLFKLFLVYWIQSTCS